MQGYGFSAGVCTLCTAGNTAGAAGSAACAACPANSFCALGTAGTTAVAAVGCPTASTSVASSDDILDCVCSVAGAIIDTVGNACVSTYTGGSNCLKFDASTTAS